MSLSIVQWPKARRDLLELADYIARDNPAEAERFLQAVDVTLELLSRLPDIGNPWETDNPRCQDIRFQAVKGFPNYLVFYRVLADAIAAVRYFHGAQDIHGLLG